jgi:undecaprenyl diphosphate synthase
MSALMPRGVAGARRASLGRRGGAVSEQRATLLATRPRRCGHPPNVWRADHTPGGPSHVVCSTSSGGDSSEELCAHHVAIIMDGNTRWSAAKGQPIAAGHAAGAAALTRVVRRACEVPGLKELTCFAFCADNWRRPADEVAGLFQVMHASLDTHLGELSSAGVRLSVIGDTSALPPPLVAALLAAQQATRSNSGLHLTVAINYSGRRHVAAAVRAVAAQVAAGFMCSDDIDEAVFSAFMATCGQYTDVGEACEPWEVLGEPDLLIRTSGEQRLSNFLLWHLAWTELYFTDTLWPDFDEKSLDAALAWFSNRKRRFGSSSAHRVDTPGAALEAAPST